MTTMTDTERIPLSRQIATIEQVADLPTDELERLNAEHEAECVMLAGQIEANLEANWVHRARQALRVLRLHRGWISRELKRRKRLEAKAEQKHISHAAREAKKNARREHMERQRAAEEAKMQRIKASNDKNAQQIVIFKEVAREVLGAEMYGHLWELTRQRIEKPALNDSTKEG